MKKSKTYLVEIALLSVSHQENRNMFARKILRNE